MLCLYGIFVVLTRFLRGLVLGGELVGLRFQVVCSCLQGVGLLLLLRLHRNAVRIFLVLTRFLRGLVLGGELVGLRFQLVCRGLQGVGLLLLLRLHRSAVVIEHLLLIRLMLLQSALLVFLALFLRALVLGGESVGLRFQVVCRGLQGVGHLLL